MTDVKTGIPLEYATARVRPITDAIWGVLSEIQTHRAPVRVVFLGAGAEAGTSTLAAATALGLARNTHQRVHLIEMNVERPALRGYLGLSNTAGLSEVLDQRLRLEDAMVDVREARGLFVLHGGGARVAAAGELSTASARELWERLGTDAAFVFYDAPPLVERPEVRVLLDEVDAVVLVVRSGATLRKEAQRSAEILKASGVPVLGTIVNAYEPELGYGVR